MTTLYCIYCGYAREFFCRQCGENHLATAREFHDANGEWPCDLDDDEIAELEATNEQA
jgi:hypothetical protein